MKFENENDKQACAKRILSMNEREVNDIYRAIDAIPQDYPWVTIKSINLYFNPEPELYVFHGEFESKEKEFTVHKVSCDIREFINGHDNIVGEITRRACNFDLKAKEPTPVGRLLYTEPMNQEAYQGDEPEPTPEPMPIDQMERYMATATEQAIERIQDQEILRHNNAERAEMRRRVYVTLGTNGPIAEMEEPAIRTQPLTRELMLDPYRSYARGSAGITNEAQVTNWEPEPVVTEAAVNRMNASIQRTSQSPRIVGFGSTSNGADTNPTPEPTQTTPPPVRPRGIMDAYRYYIQGRAT